MALVFVALLGAIATGSTKLAAFTLCLAIAVVSIRVLESWPVLLTTLLIVIFAIPIKRYKLPGGLPFDLEPYRIVVMALTLIWVGALLVDRRVRLRRSAFDMPLLLLMFAALASASANVGYIEQLAVVPDVVKTVSFFASFLLVYFIIATVVTARSQVEFLVRVIVVLGALVSMSGVVEYWTGYNVFNHISKIIPVLQYQGDLSAAGLTRSDRLRVYASAQHPIALAAALALILPLSLYLAQTTRRRVWWIVSFLIGLGALSTLSRTGVVAIFAAGLALLAVRPADTRRLIPILVPALVVVFFALPNALGTFKSAFFPQGGIVAEQTALEANNQLYGNGRLADVGPTLRQWRERPIFGQGYGSRIVEIGPRQNAAILDNQWLAFLLETGALGIFALVWTLGRAVRRLGGIARRDGSDLGLLAGSLAASIVGFAVGIFTFDAFGFIQVTLLFFIILAIGAVVIGLSEDEHGASAYHQRQIDDPHVSL